MDGSCIFSSRALIRFPEQLTSVISLTDELILNAQSAKQLQTGAHNASVRAADAHRWSGRWGNNNRHAMLCNFSAQSHHKINQVDRESSSLYTY